jgi:hypothetical protein
MIANPNWRKLGKAFKDKYGCGDSILSVFSLPAIFEK